MAYNIKVQYKENIDDIFASALRACLTVRGSQSRLARDIGVSRQQVSDLLSQRRRGSESLRRKIADALGYPGPKYEDFLNIGRRALGLIEAEEDVLEPEPRLADDGADWKEKYLAELKSHDETLNALLSARRKIAELEKRGLTTGGAGRKRPPKKAG